MIWSADVALLLSTFESEATPLKVSFLKKEASVTLFLQADVMHFAEGEMLCLMTDNQDFCFVSLRDCRCEYRDERALPELLRERAKQKFEGR